MKFFLPKKLKTLSALIWVVLMLSFACKEKAKTDQMETGEEPEAVTEERLGGLALYTVREQMANDPKETLTQVAEIGYQNIEAAGYAEGKFYGMTPSEFRALLEEVDLHPISTHQGGMTLENADAMIADVKNAGFKYFVVPIPPMGMFQFNPETREMSMSGTAKQLADILEELGTKCNEAGLQLLYHNHDFEFKEDAEGNVVLDYLLENLDSEIINFQMDLYWATKAGKDPLEYFEKYPGRFKAWHVKDMDEQGRFAPVGTGSIDFKRILEQKDLSGMEYYFVEQDMTFDGLQPLEAIKISHEAIQELGFH